MYTLCIVLTVLISILLIVVVLIQKSKGGGLSSSFAGSNQIMGVRRTNDFIEKATWTLAGIILVLSIASVFVMPSKFAVSNVAPRQAVSVVKGTETSAPAAATPVQAETPAAEAAETPAAAPVAAPAAEAPAAPAAEAPAN